jgi:hypothetical protein
MPIASGTLIAESLRPGGAFEGVALCVRKIARADVGDTSVGQPLTWTFVDFEVPVDDLDAVTAALSSALDPVLGWYCDLRSPDETFVVFADRVFRYPRGDTDGRREVERFARSVGVPEGQLDWPE